MRVAVTGNAGPLGPALVVALAGGHDVRWAPTSLPGTRPEGIAVLEGDLRDPEFVSRFLDHVEALVHLAPLDSPPDDDPTGIERIDRATRGTYVLLQGAGKSGVRQVVVAGSLELFDRLPAAWRVTEAWRPRPRPTPEHLAAYMAEISAREIARVSPMRTVCLRFGEIVEDADVCGQAFDPRWVHAEDALQAVQRALELTEADAAGWGVYHIAALGPRARVRVSGAARPPFEYTPQHDFRDWWPPKGPEPPATWAWEREIEAGGAIPSRPIRRVLFFGSGGPLAAAAARVMAPSYMLRLTDRRPLAEIVAENKPQSPGAPMPDLLGPPHEMRVVDVTDPAQVMEAARGMDAIVNCTVVRPDPVEAFRVNTLGAYNVMRAALAHGIRRVVQTGPQLVALGGPAGYSPDYGLSADAPPRPADNLYAHTKFLGQEICRVFAEYHAMEVPVLLFSNFSSPERLRERGRGLGPFSVSWDDAAEAMRCAVAAPGFPSPYEVMHIITDLPHERYTNEKAKRLLDWQPRDRLESAWSVPPEGEE